MTSGRTVGIHHIGVTVSDAKATLNAWESLLDCKGKVVDIPENKMKIGVLHVAGVTFFFNEYTASSKKAKTVEELELITRGTSNLHERFLHPPRDQFAADRAAGGAW